MNAISELKELLKSGDSSAIIEFAKQHPEVLNQKDENNTSGILLIAYQSSKDTLAVVAKFATDLNFYEAVVCGKEDEVKTQLTTDPELLNAYAPDGFTPIALACFFDRDDIAKYLIQQGADPNINANNPSKVNALHAAVAKNNIELCKLLIANGADVNITQVQNVTPLLSAVHRGNLPLVKLLVESGADISSAMDNGDTAMSIVARDGHAEIKAYLEGL